jgi:hypothetical protein
MHFKAQEKSNYGEIAIAHLMLFVWDGQMTWRNSGGKKKKEKKKQTNVKVKRQSRRYHRRPCCSLTKFREPKSAQHNIHTVPNLSNVEIRPTQFFPYLWWHPLLLPRSARDLLLLLQILFLQRITGLAILRLGLFNRRHLFIESWQTTVMTQRISLVSG